MIMEHLQIELPEKYKNVIKDATIEIVDGNIIITPKKQEFKDGDICYFKNIACECILIYKGCSEKLNGLIARDYYASLDLNTLEIGYNSWCDDRIKRLATDEEKKVLFEALEKQGKHWNHETKQIEDILKVGDLAIFWDDDKSKAIISTVCEVYLLQPVPYISACGRFFNAIKCTSLEQYINFIK